MTRFFRLSFRSLSRRGNGIPSASRTKYSHDLDQYVSAFSDRFNAIHRDGAEVTGNIPYQPWIPQLLLQATQPNPSQFGRTTFLSTRSYADTNGYQNLLSRFLNEYISGAYQARHRLILHNDDSCLLFDFKVTLAQKQCVVIDLSGQSGLSRETEVLRAHRITTLSPSAHVSEHQLIDRIVDEDDAFTNPVQAINMANQLSGLDWFSHFERNSIANGGVYLFPPEILPPQLLQNAQLSSAQQQGLVDLFKLRDNALLANPYGYMSATEFDKTVTSNTHTSELGTHNSGILNVLSSMACASTKFLRTHLPADIEESLAEDPVSVPQYSPR